MNNISIIGAGTMGNGIVHVFAQIGHKVTLIDNNPLALEKAISTISGNLDRQIAKGTISQADKQNTLSCVTTHTNIEAGVAEADLVIEAATENKELKIRLFQAIDAHAPSVAILATNTSSISITAIAAHTKHPENVIGMHFMNPVCACDETG